MWRRQRRQPVCRHLASRRHPHEARHPDHLSPVSERRAVQAAGRGETHVEGPPEEGIREAIVKVHRRPLDGERVQVGEGGEGGFSTDLRAYPQRPPPRTRRPTVALIIWVIVA